MQVKNGKPNKILLGVPQDFLRERTVYGSFVRERSGSKISKTEEKLVYRKVLGEAANEIGKMAAENFGIMVQDFDFLSFRVFKIRIDGYDVPYLEGYKGKNLEFEILSVFSPKDYIKEVKDTLKKLKLKVIKIIPEIEALLSFFKKTNAVFIDIGGRSTRIFVIWEDRPEQLHEIATGESVFVEAIAKILGLKLDDAASLQEDYSKGALSEGAANKLKEIFAPYLEEWFGLVKDKLSEQGKLLPSDVFIFGGGSLLPDFRKAMEEHSWDNTIFIKDPIIKVLRPQDLIQNKGQSALIRLNSPQYSLSLLMANYAQKDF